VKNPNTKKYWDKKFENSSFSDMGHIPHRVKLYRFLVDILPRDKKFSLFEIGCGSGYGLEFIEKNFPLAKLYGLDFSEVAIKKAKKKYPNINFEIGDIQSYKFIRKYSYIAMIRTLEHLTKPFAIIDECLKYTTDAVIIDLPGSVSDPFHVNVFNFHDFDNYAFDELSVTKRPMKWPLKLIIYGKKNI